MYLSFGTRLAGGHIRDTRINGYPHREDGTTGYHLAFTRESNRRFVIRGTTLTLYGLQYSPLSIGPSAFMRPRSTDSWSDIPHGPYDILLSHSPPRGHLHQNRRGQHIGCDHFLAAIQRVRPSVAIFGHVHEARGEDGIEWGDGTITRLYNIAVMNRTKRSPLRPLTPFKVSGTE